MVIDGVGFVGVKGFAGGFGRRMLEPWGEATIKQFVQTRSTNRSSSSRRWPSCACRSRVVLMHYAPIEATVTGEPPELYPFLGCSRLEEPLNRHGVNAVFHGHAHYGAPEGKTRDGIPVYNVAAPLLRRLHPEAPPYRIVGIPRDERWGQDSAEML